MAHDGLRRFAGRCLRVDRGHIDEVLTIAEIVQVSDRHRTARSAGAYVTLYYSQDLVGSSTQDLTVESQIFATQYFDAATTARTHSQSGIWLPPSASIKFALYNGTGQALNASGSTVKIIPWYTQAV